jgi:hypothetical protein
MSRISTANLSAEFSDRSLPADIFLRSEPDEEEDEEEEEDSGHDSEENENEDGGYSE